MTGFETMIVASLKDVANRAVTRANNALRSGDASEAKAENDFAADHKKLAAMIENGTLVLRKPF